MECVNKKPRKPRRRKYAIPSSIKYIPVPENVAETLPDKKEYGYQWLLTDEYKWLTLEQQDDLAHKRRGRGRPPKVWLRTLSKPTQDDWDKLCVFVTNVLLNSSTPIAGKANKMRTSMFVIHLPFNYRRVWDKSWPRGRIVGYSDWGVWLEYNAANVLDYMYENGYSGYSAKDLGNSLKSFAADMMHIEMYNRYAIEKCIRELYEGIVNKHTGKNDGKE